MTDRDPECLFCRIVAGEIPSDRVLEDDEVIAFRDIAPRAPTHVLIIPRRHIPDAHSLTDADGDLLARLFAAGRRIADERRAGTGLSDRDQRRARVRARRCFHLHLHLLGGQTDGWPPG